MSLNGKVRVSRTASNKKRFLGSKYRLVLFVVLIAITGGVYKLLSTKAAVNYYSDVKKISCVSISADGLTPDSDKYVVLPGKSFTGKVTIKNITTNTTFAPSYGVGLSEFRDGPLVWNNTGSVLSNNIGPGATQTFNLKLKSPNTTGTYSYDWGLFVGLLGFVKDVCRGKPIIVSNPPAIQSLTTNNQSVDINLTRGASLNLNWSASSTAPATCNASGNWSGSKPSAGSENRTVDTSIIGTKTYTLTCSNAVGSSGTITRRVTVTNPDPLPSTNPSSSSRPSGSSSGGTKPSSSSSNPSVNIANLPAPTAPLNFTAELYDESSVQLLWEEPEYEGNIAGYDIERSTDKTTYEPVSQDVIPEANYLDKTIKFSTKYYYRIRAVAENGKKSDFVNAEISSGAFEPNTGKELELLSEDQRLKVVIPDDAIEEPAFCSLVSDDDVLAPTVEGFDTIAGPYQILCKKEDGSIIEKFATPVTVSYQADEKAYKSFAFYEYQDDWQQVEGETVESTGSFELTDSISFAILGEKKSTPLFVKILIFLVVLAGIIFGGLIGYSLYVKYKQRKNAKNKSQDYYHKEHGY